VFDLDAGPVTIKVAPRYLVAGIRTLGDPMDPKDIAQVHACRKHQEPERQPVG
jgi:hypothetical protein